MLALGKVTLLKINDPIKYDHIKYLNLFPYLYNGYEYPHE